MDPIFKRLMLSMPLCRRLIIASMSIKSTPENLKDTDCKKGYVAQQPPIPYMPVTSLLKTSTSAELIKVKLIAAGNLICLEVFEDGNHNRYLKHLMTLQQLMATKGVEEKLLLATRELGDKNKILKTLRKLRTRETREAKEHHLLKVSKAES
jgi:hypothetical protein